MKREGLWFWCEPDWKSYTGPNAIRWPWQWPWIAESSIIKQYPGLFYFEVTPVWPEYENS